MTSLELSSPAAAKARAPAKPRVTEKTALRQGLLALAVCTLMLLAAAGIRTVAAFSSPTTW